MTTLLEFLRMGGYGIYVWTAYGAVFALLTVQWLLPWRRWQRFLARTKI